MSTQALTLDLIVKHGIMVRQIPFSVTQRWTKRPNQILKEGEELVVINDREFIVTTRIPRNAGKWMAKTCKSTSSEVRWNIKTDNLSSTLHEAVLKAAQAQ